MWTKLLLPIVALLLLAALAVWPEWRAVDGHARIAYRLSAAAAKSGTMMGVHYQGLDSRGEPYTVTAQKVVQRNPQHIDLTHPVGDITLRSGRWVLLKARAGMYEPASKTLHLAHHVTLYRDDGTTMQTKKAVVHLQKGTASGNTPVAAFGPFGTLHATGFSLTDRGAKIVFTGPARLVISSAAP